MSWTPPSLRCVAILFPCQMGSFDKSPFSQPFCIFSLPFPITSPPTALKIETPKQQCSQLFATSYLQTREHPHLTSSCSFSTVTVEEVPFLLSFHWSSVPYSFLSPQETWSLICLQSFPFFNLAFKHNRVFWIWKKAKTKTLLLTMLPSNSTLRYLPKRNENVSTQRLVLRCSQQHYSEHQKLETTQMSFNWRMHLNKIWDINLMKCNSIIKSNKVLIHATPRTNLKNIMFREISQMQKNTYCMVPFTQNYSPQKANLEEEKIVFFCNLSVNGHKGSFGGDGSILRVVHWK